MRDLINCEGIGNATSDHPFGEIVNNQTELCERIMGDWFNALHRLTGIVDDEATSNPDNSDQTDAGLHRYQIADLFAKFTRLVMERGWKLRDGSVYDTGYAFNSYIVNNCKIENSLSFSQLVSVTNALTCIYNNTNIEISTTDDKNAIIQESGKQTIYIDKSSYLFSSDNENVFKIYIDSGSLYLILNNTLIFTVEAVNFAFYPSDYAYLVVWDSIGDLIYYKINLQGDIIIQENLFNSSVAPSVSMDVINSTIYLHLIDTADTVVAINKNTGEQINSYALTGTFNTFRMNNNELFFFENATGNVNVYDSALNWLRSFYLGTEVTCMNHSTRYNRFLCIDNADNVGYLSLIV